MTDHPALDDDALDAMLRLAAPGPLADDGFVSRTMAAVDAANHALPARRRAAPRAPLSIARALVAEDRRHAAQARLWRWAMGGVAAGYVLMLLAMAVSPGGISLSITGTSPSQWVPLSLTMCAGALWVSWRTLRSS